MSVKVKLIRSEDGQFTIDLGSKALPRITYNPMALDPEVRKVEHMGERLMLAAALACYVNTLAGDLKRGEASRVAEIRAEAEAVKEKGSDLRTRFTSVDLAVETEVAEEDMKLFESVRQSLLRGSLTTYSLEEGIEFNYDIEAV